MKKASAIGLAVLMTGMGFVAGHAAAEHTAMPGCADPHHPGGEWRSYGGGPLNQRNQPAEDQINPSTVANLAPAWKFDVNNPAQAGAAGGSLQNTPVVADGCVYLATSSGYVIALNADTGQRVWTSVRMPGSSAGSLVGGTITGSPLVANNKVYVGVSRRNAPFVAALDQATGQLLWDVTKSNVIDPAKGKPEYNTTTVSGPVLIDGMIFQGVMAAEETPGARGGYAFIDAETGALIHQDWTISDAEYAAGYRGASIWCTAAADVETKHVYACGGNPASKQKEARYANSLLKIDADRTRPTFGQIVGAFKGNYDQYYPGLDRQPACDTVPVEQAVWSPTCVQLDLDFGASPSLYTIDVGGKPVKLLGDLQKSGIYYAVFADNMQLAWSTVVGAPGPTFNASSPAVDGNNVYVAAVPPGQIVGLSNDRGRYRWASPVPTAHGLFFESVSTAKGVVYAVDNFGVLHAIDAATGLPVKHFPITRSDGAPAVSQSSHGVAIARNTVYAAAASYVVAYR